MQQDVTQGLSDKSDSLATKMNRITEKLTNNLELSDEMELNGNDILDFVKEKTVILQSTHDSVDAVESIILTGEIINLEAMVQDFKYIRETLKENTDNGKRILNVVTLDLLDTDDEKRISLITAFAELNRAIADNMKLYITAYREISNVLLNINKINESNIGNPKTKITQNEMDPVSTIDLLKKLS